MALSIQQQTFQCTSCPCSFTTGRGYARHQLAQKRHEESASTTTETASSIISADSRDIDSVIRANLSPFLPVNPILKQAYNIILGAYLAKSINTIYEDHYMVEEPVFNTIWATGQKIHTALIRMIDSSQQHLL